MTRRWLLPLLILSGFAGLAYELLWVRLLTFSLGSTTASFSTVLAVFFGGLAAGSRWAGRRSVSARFPLRAYALLELATGALGILLYPILVSLGPLMARFDPGTGVGGLVLRLFVATVVLLPPSFLMGATLPFVTVASVRSDAAAGSGVSLIYGFNTFGACVGAYTITFHLLPHLGIFRSTLVVVALNVLVGVVTLLLAKRQGDGRAAVAPVDDGSAPPQELDPKMRLAVILATLIGGFAATGAQVVWARSFAILLGGTSYGIGSVLVSVLVGIALGSLLAARLMARSQHAPLSAAAIQAGVLFGIVLFVLGIPVAGYLVGLLPTAGLTGNALHHGDLLVAMLVLAAPTIASGASMPALVAVLSRSAATAGDTLSRVYTANTIGCILGSLGVGLLLLPMIGSAAVLYLLFLLLTLALAIFVVATCQERRFAGAALVALSLAGAAFFPSLDSEALMPRDPLTIDYFSYVRQLQQVKKVRLSNYEGDVATVRVSKTGQGKGLALNGLGQGSRNEVPPDIAFESTLVATIPWQHAPRHERGLVIGLGAGGTVRKLVQLGVSSLEVAELERGVVAAVADIWGEQNPLNDPRVKLINNDARSYLLSTSYKTPRSYDFITSMPAHPWVASALFTTEFFQLVRSNLSEDGVFATWFGPGNMQDESVEALFGAFTSVFPSWLIYWIPEAGAFYLVGSGKPLLFDVASIERLATHEVYAGVDRSLVTPLYFAARLVAHSSKGPPSITNSNSDDNGLIEFGVQQQRRTSPLEVLKRFPVQGLTPELVRGTEPRSFLLAALETALGTEGGRLPVTSGQTGAARGMAAALAGTPVEELGRYAQARLLLMESKEAEAEKVAATLSDPELQLRFKRFAAWSSQKEPSARIASLSAIEQTVDTRAALIALGVPDAGPSLTTLAAGDDALSWLFAEPSAWASLTPDLKAATAVKLAARLEQFRSAALFRLAEKLAGTVGIRQMEILWRERALTTGRREARRSLGEAYEAGSKGDYATALKRFRSASSIQPIDLEAARLYLRTAVQQKDQGAVDEVRALLILRNQAPETVDGLVEKYKTDAALEQPSGSSTPTPASGRDRPDPASRPGTETNER